MLTVAGVNVEKEAGERIDSPASDAFSVLYPIPLDKQEFIVLLFDISSNTVLAFQLAKPSSSI